MRLPTKIDELTEEQLLEQMEAQQKAVKQAREAQENSMLMSMLQSKYTHYTGKKPDNRWKADTLRRKITEAKAATEE